MGISLYTEQFGKGIPLVLLHGNGESMEYFQNQVDAFREHFHVYAIDTRGHGKSPRGEAPFTIFQFAKDLERWRRSHSIRKMVILGFSDGANIAIEYALCHPERPLALILDGGNLFPEGLKVDVIEGIRRAYEEAKAEGDSEKEELFSLMAYEPNIEPSLLQKVECPVLVIQATEDCVDPEHAKLIASSFPKGEYAEVEGTHYCALENPEEFNSLVLSFLHENFSF